MYVNLYMYVFVKNDVMLQCIDQTHFESEDGFSLWMRWLSIVMNTCVHIESPTVLLHVHVHVGVEFPETPDVGSVPLVCDVSSNFLTRPIDVGKVGGIL